MITFLLYNKTYMQNKIVDELKKYVKRYCLIRKIDKAQSNAIINSVCDDYLNGNFDFENSLKFRKVTKFNKKRLIAYFEAGSVEFFLSKYIASVIKKQTDLKFALVSDTVNLLINSLVKVENVNDFAIVQFDFKNYYNSLCSEYIYNKFLKNYVFDKTENELLKNYLFSVPYMFAGLTPSNFIGELVLGKFQKELKTNFLKTNLIDLVRYGDDYILLFNKTHKIEEVTKTISITVNQVFFDKTIKTQHKNKVKVHLSGSKFSYITKKDLPYEINYLGYSVKIKKDADKLDYEIGVSPLLQKFYHAEMKDVILQNQSDTEKLRTLIKLKTRRLVYKKYSILEGTQIVSLNYTQNKNLIFEHLAKISPESLTFYRFEIRNLFEELGIKLPYYLKDDNEKSGYSLYSNLIRKKTVLIHPKIGYNKNTLQSTASKLKLNLKDKSTSPQEKLIDILKNKKKTL